MNFKWKGLKSNAFVDGVIDSINKDEAMFLLTKDGVIVTSIINSNPKDEKKKKTTTHPMSDSENGSRTDSNSGSNCDSDSSSDNDSNSDNIGHPHSQYNEDANW